jgi:hypothetical protein
LERESERERYERERERTLMDMVNVPSSSHMGPK